MFTVTVGVGDAPMWKMLGVKNSMSLILTMFSVEPDDQLTKEMHRMSAFIKWLVELPIRSGGRKNIVGDFLERSGSRLLFTRRVEWIIVFEAGECAV